MPMNAISWTIYGPSCVLYLVVYFCAHPRLHFRQTESGVNTVLHLDLRLPYVLLVVS
jgi:hypothetical protein